MGYYDNQEEYDKRGIDYDLCACLDYNSISFTADEIEKVLAVWEGENDADDWRWVLQLKDKRFVFLQGGCDYTGWDCQSWATCAFAESPEDAAKFALGNVDISQSSPVDAGLGHLIKIMEGYTEGFDAVYENLKSQLEKGKTQTWTEQKNEEFGVVVSVSLKLYVWKIFGDYELNIGFAIATDKKKAKQQILEKISKEDTLGFDGNLYYVDSFTRLLEENEPDVYDLSQEMSEWAHYSG